MRELQIWRVVTCIIYLTDKSGMWSLSIFLSLTHILTDIHTSSFTPSQAVFHTNAYTHTHSLTGALFLPLKLLLTQTHTHTQMHIDAYSLAHTYTLPHAPSHTLTHAYALAVEARHTWVGKSLFISVFVSNVSVRINYWSLLPWKWDVSQFIRRFESAHYN